MLELAACSLDELLHWPAAQLLDPSGANGAAGGGGGGGGDSPRAELVRPSACRALAQVLGCEPALAAAPDEALLAALAALGPAGCSASLFDRRALLLLLSQVADALA